MRQTQPEASTRHAAGHGHVWERAPLGLHPQDQGLTTLTFHGQRKKLSRGLKSRQWAALGVQEPCLKQAAQVLPANAVVARDLGDITKPRARRMPGPRTVKDGSTGQLKKGWGLVEIEAIFGKGKHLPLWLELFSVGRRGCKSQRAMVQMAIATLVQHLGTLGLWLFDRGFDNRRFFRFLESLGLKFPVRVKSKRLYEQLLAAYPSFGPEPRFPYYRIAGGLACILLLASHTQGGGLDAV